MQETEPGEQVGKKEVERAESHDSHDVGGIGEEGMAGDGENGGDGVEGEDDIRELDGDEGEAEDGDHAAAVFEDKEVILAEADGMDAGEPVEPSGWMGLFLGVFGQEQTDGAEEEDCGEDVADPVEAFEQAEAGGNEGSAHEDRTGDSPEEDFGLAGWGDFEDIEKEKEDEEVVDGEGLFDGVAGKVLCGGLAAEGVEDEESEGQRGRYPKDSGGDGG